MSHSFNSIIFLKKLRNKEFHSTTKSELNDNNFFFSLIVEDEIAGRYAWHIQITLVTFSSVKINSQVPPVGLNQMTNIPHKNELIKR